MSHGSVHMKPDLGPELAYDVHGELATGMDKNTSNSPVTYNSMIIVSSNTSYKRFDHLFACVVRHIATTTTKAVLPNKPPGRLWRPV
jgi:hypothetical protein